MRRIFISQRVDLEPKNGERRDGLDSRWFDFLEKVDCLPLPVPNRVSLAKAMTNELMPDGIILTGGNDLAVYGGDVPERDRTERYLLEYAMMSQVPLIGVCRGMQLIQDYFGLVLDRVEGHVTPRQQIIKEGRQVWVNSYHRYGTKQSQGPLKVWAYASDGIIKAIRHVSEEILGVMWHPERNSPFCPEDLAMFQNLFRERAAV